MRKVALLVGLLIVGGSGSALAHDIACPVSGSDGDRVLATTATTEQNGKVPSNTQDVFAHWLCCNNAGGACEDFDTSSKAGGSADRYIISLENTDLCTAVDVDIGFREDASGVNHTVGTITLGTDSLVIDGPRPRFVTATVNAATDCETGADLRINTYYDRGNLQP